MEKLLHVFSGQFHLFSHCVPFLDQTKHWGTEGYKGQEEQQHLNTPE